MLTKIRTQFSKIVKVRKQNTFNIFIFIVFSKNKMMILIRNEKKTLNILSKMFGLFFVCFKLFALYFAIFLFTVFGIIF